MMMRNLLQALFDEPDGPLFGPAGLTAGTKAPALAGKSQQSFWIEQSSTDSGDPTTVEILGLIVSVAIILGVIIALIKFAREWVLSIPKVKVELKDQIHIINIPGKIPEELMLKFTATNPRKPPVTLNQHHIAIKGSTHILIVIPLNDTPHLPTELTYRKSWSTWISRTYIANELKKAGFKDTVKICCVLGDQTKKQYRSRYILFDIGMN